MAINVHASGNADPENNPNANPELDLSVVSLPQDVQLYGWAEDTADASATWTWNWTLMSGPAGHTAALDDSTAQNPTLEGIDVAGNYLLFLQATNTNTGPTASQSDPLQAASEAFVVVKCLTANQGLQKPAEGERGWTEAYHDLVDAVEGMGGPGAHSITDHTDIVDATGAQIEILTGGGVAEESSNALHLHYGAHIQEASRTNRGTLRTEADPFDPASPVACNMDAVVFSQLIDDHYNGSSWQPGLGVTSGSGVGFYDAVWRMPWVGEIEEWSVSLRHRGVAISGGALTLSLHLGVPSQLAANSLPEVTTMSFVVSSSNDQDYQEDLVGGAGGNAFPLSVNPGQIIAVRVKASDANTGTARGGNVSVVCRRQVQ